MAALAAMAPAAALAAAAPAEAAPEIIVDETMPPRLSLITSIAVVARAFRQLEAP